MKESIWNQILIYLYIRKRNTDAPKNIDLKLMHGINRISIVLFLFAIIVIILRLLFRH